MISFIKKHYHWVIAGLILLELAVYGGILNNLSSLHLIPVTEDLGISRGSFSLAMSVRSLVGFFSTLFSGVFFLKYGYRRMASAALAVVALGLLTLGFSRNLAMIILGSALMGISEGFCSTAAASRVVNTWFRSHQGLILGLVTASTGLGGSLFSVVLSGVIEAGNWRMSYWLSGALVAAVALLLLLFSRDRPSDMGLRPFGEGTSHGKKPRKENGDHWPGYEARDIYHKPTFYLMILVVFLSCGCNYVAFYVLAPHLQDCGMTPQEAAMVQSVLLLGLAAAKLICGALSDWLGSRTINLLCMLCTVLGLWMLAEVTGVPMALGSAVVFSIGLSLTTITVPLLSSTLFGYRAQGTIIGIFMAMPPAASVITSPIVNALYDRIGSYRPIFRVTALLALAVTGLMVLLFILAARDRKKFESVHSPMPKLEDIL